MPNSEEKDSVPAWLTLHQIPLCRLLGILREPKSKARLAPKGKAPGPLRLTLNNCRVLLHLFTRVDYGNWIAIPQSELALELGISRQAYNRALSDLQKTGWIQRPYVKTPLGVRPIIMLNPDLGEKGRKDSLEKKKSTYQSMKDRTKKRARAGIKGQSRPGSITGTSQAMKKNKKA
jgi:predicted transcriptional regulator